MQRGQASNYIPQQLIDTYWVALTLLKIYQMTLVLYSALIEFHGNKGKRYSAKSSVHLLN